MFDPEEVLGRSQGHTVGRRQVLGPYGTAMSTLATYGIASRRPASGEVGPPPGFSRSCTLSTLSISQR